LLPAVNVQANPSTTRPGRSRVGAQVRRHLVRDYHRRLAAGYVWAEGDVAWSERNTALYPAICSLAGVVAGAFGVGGGVVKARGTCTPNPTLTSMSHTG